VEDTVTVAVQINGKLRATLDLPRGAPQDTVRDAALADERVRRYVDGAEVRKVVYVPDKLLNLVIAPR
jgi:leucyl-tRNA synthetase